MEVFNHFFQSNALHIIIQQIEIWRVRGPNVRGVVVVQILNNHFLQFLSLIECNKNMFRYIRPIIACTADPRLDSSVINESYLHIFFKGIYESQCNQQHYKMLLITQRFLNPCEKKMWRQDSILITIMLLDTKQFSITIINEVLFLVFICFI